MHRLYLTSIPAETARWSRGVNVICREGAVTAVELTAVPRRGRAAVVGLATREAELLREAIIEAVERIQRRAGRDDI